MEPQPSPAPLRLCCVSPASHDQRRARHRLHVPRSALSATARLVRHAHAHHRRVVACAAACAPLRIEGRPSSQGALSCKQRGAGSWHGESQRKCVASTGRCRGASSFTLCASHRMLSAAHPARTDGAAEERAEHAERSDSNVQLHRLSALRLSSVRAPGTSGHRTRLLVLGAWHSRAAPELTT